MFSDQDVLRYLNRAIDLARQNVREGGGPFGALIITADGSEYQGVNRVVLRHDPTAHAEVTAIRIACEDQKTFSLEDAVLFSSCEPCPMCLAASKWARVSKVYYAADRYMAADAGFDDLAFYNSIERPTEADRAFCSRPAGIDSAAPKPFTTWAENKDTVTPY